MNIIIFCYFSSSQIFGIFDFLKINIFYCGRFRFDSRFANYQHETICIGLLIMEEYFTVKIAYRYS